MANLKPRPYHIDCAIGKLHQLYNNAKARDFPVKTRHSWKANELFMIALLGFCRPEISPQALQENYALELAKQSVHYQS